MAPSDAAALTAQLRAHLQSYLAHSAAISQTLRDANTLQHELEAGQGKDVRDQLESVYDRIDEQTEAEFSQLDVAMDLLDAIDAAQAAAHPADVGAVKKSQHKKRAKIDASSRAASPASSAAPSPLPSFAGSPPLHAPPLPRSGSHAAKPPPLLPAASSSSFAGSTHQHPTPIAPAPPSSSTSSSHGGGGKKASGPPTLKSRRDALAAQLPLRPGRPIAVKESKKSAVPGAPPGAGSPLGGPPGAADNYILGRIVMCLGGDKNRYTVEDVDYDPANPTPEGGKWNTTLKSIIPLPEKGDERSYPDYDFSPGTYVLACYPETTSFYRAVIAAGPLAVATGQGKKKEVQRIYRLTFDDDEGAIRDVPLELVCDPTPL
ncbi:hypothetical protein JCM8208_002975 [Rhodotorula glutinis]